MIWSSSSQDINVIPRKITFQSSKIDLVCRLVREGFEAVDAKEASGSSSSSFSCSDGMLRHWLMVSRARQPTPCQLAHTCTAVSTRKAAHEVAACTRGKAGSGAAQKEEGRRGHRSLQR